MLFALLFVTLAFLLGFLVVVKFRRTIWQYNIFFPKSLERSFWFVVSGVFLAAYLVTVILIVHFVS